MTAEKRYSFTQPLCASCWLEDNPGRRPHRVHGVAEASETCCQCGQPTSDGIYIRVDPTTIPHPTLERTP
jgi:hypothetical protein